MGLFRRAATLPPGEPVRSPREIRLRTATDGRDILVNDPDGWEIDQPWLWWLGPKGSDGSGGPFGNPPPGADGPAGVQALPAVRRCTSLICDTISGLPWQVFRGDYEKLTTPPWLEDPQALRIDGRVIDPATVTSVRLSQVEFWGQWIRCALWFGDGYVYVPVRDVTGAPKPPLWILHPDQVTIDHGTYWVGDIPLPSESIIHLRGGDIDANGNGSGVLTNPELGLAITVREYASGVFTTGIPAGYLKSTAPAMDQTKADELKARWLAQHGGSKRSIAVLNATTEFHPIAISPIDAQLTAAREWSLRDIALAFGVPPYMLGVPGDSSTYANVESRHIELRSFTLLPWETRIEATLGAQLPMGTRLSIRSDALLRADTKTRFSAYKDAIDAGWLTVNEVRELEALAPLPEGGVA